MVVFSSKKDTKSTAHSGVLSRDHAGHLETEQKTLRSKVRVKEQTIGNIKKYFKLK